MQIGGGGGVGGGQTECIMGNLQIVNRPMTVPYFPSDYDYGRVRDTRTGGRAF